MKAAEIREKEFEAKSENLKKQINEMKKENKYLKEYNQRSILECKKSLKNAMSERDELKKELVQAENKERENVRNIKIMQFHRSLDKSKNERKSNANFQQQLFKKNEMQEAKKQSERFKDEQKIEIKKLEEKLKKTKLKRINLKANLVEAKQQLSIKDKAIEDSKVKIKRFQQTIESQQLQKEQLGYEAKKTGAAISTLKTDIKALKRQLKAAAKEKHAITHETKQIISGLREKLDRTHVLLLESQLSESTVKKELEHKAGIIIYIPLKKLSLKI